MIDSVFTLPPQPTPLIGRYTEIAAFTARLREPDVRMVTLTGPGGVGKTRLALALAEHLRDEYTDGACFVELAPFTDPALVADAIAQALGLHASSDRPLLDAITSSLGGRELLLVLDNFEQVLDAAPLVGTLLTACPALDIIVTSRAPLHLRWEHQIAVTPLLDADAAELFRTRARAAGLTSALSMQDRTAVAAICAPSIVSRSRSS